MPTETLRERVRERLGVLIDQRAWLHVEQKAGLIEDILREFRLQPVVVGRVAGDDSEVTPL